MKVRGITCGDTRRVVEAALQDHRWTYEGIAGKGHGRLRWLPTGEVVTFGLTPSDRNSWKNTARDIERVCGFRVAQRGNSKPGRHKAAKPVRSKKWQSELDRIEAEILNRERRAQEAVRKERRRRTSAAAAEREDARRREIEALMRPGYGR